VLVVVVDDGGRRLAVVGGTEVTLAALPSGGPLFGAVVVAARDGAGPTASSPGRGEGRIALLVGEDEIGG
jgi:hypothetical protein